MFVTAIVLTVSLAQVLSVPDPNLDARCKARLVKELDNQNFSISLHSAEALTDAGCGSLVVEKYAPALETEKDDVKRSGLSRELVRAGKPEYASVIMEILAKPGHYAKAHCAEAIFKVRFKCDPNLLIARSADSNSTIALWPSAALASLGCDAGFKSNLKSPDSSSRAFAAWVMAEAKCKDSLDVLQAGLDDPDTDVRVRSAHAVLVMTK